MALHSFEDLEVWKLACRIATGLYSDLAKCRDYGLRDQMTRAAVSVASNIAEGAERGSKPDFARFIGFAKGSAAELRTQVYIAERIGILSVDQKSGYISELKQVSAMLHGLTQSLAIPRKPLR